MLDEDDILDFENCEKKEIPPRNYVGKRVTRSAIFNDDTEPTIDCGIIVSAWDDYGEIDCYIAFFGTSFPDGSHPGKPYILNYYLKSLVVLDDTRPVEYRDWISTNVVKNNGYGICKEVCENMQKAFPHLELQKGIFQSFSWGERRHWWLFDPVINQIVDPTARQHPDGENLPRDVTQYQDMTTWTEEQIMDVVPSGKCMECGEPVFHNKTFCSDQCGETFTTELNASLRIL